MKTALMASFVAAGAVSCGQSVFHEPERTPLEFAAGVLTKTVADGGMLPSAYALCISAHLSDSEMPENGLDYFTAHPFIYDGGTWKGSPEVYLPLSGSLDYLCLATEPGGPDLFSSSEWSRGDASKGVRVEINDGSALDTEILYASGSSGKTVRSAAALDMKHSQCLHRFTFTSNSDGLVRIDRIEIDKAYTGGLLTVANDAFLLSSWSFDGHRLHQPFIIGASENIVLDRQKRTVNLLLPAQPAGRITIFYRRRDSLSDSWSSAPVRQSLVYTPETESWLAGKRYEYSVHARLDEFIVSLSVEPWGTASGTVSSLG